MGLSGPTRLPDSRAHTSSTFRALSTPVKNWFARLEGVPEHCLHASIDPEMMPLAVADLGLPDRQPHRSKLSKSSASAAVQAATAIPEVALVQPSVTDLLSTPASRADL
jgi:hypothetical protein